MKNKIFGIGLSKTGTSSLSEALNVLGIHCIHYPDDAVTLHELRSGQYKLSLLEKYQGVADTPVVPYFAQLDKEYPGSKFILTTRDMDSWLESVRKHWETSPQFEHEPLRKEFQTFIRTAVYGCVEFNEDRFRYVYETHYNNVIKYFKDRPQDLLVIDICQGDEWEKLCAFLGVEKPDVPFPHANQWMHKLIKATEEMQSLIPENSTCLLIDDQPLGKEFTVGRNFIPFPEEDGVYMGSPASDEEAITKFRDVVSKYDPTYVVIGWPSFWWQDVYPEFMKCLKSKYGKILVEDEELLILQPSSTTFVLCSG